MTVANRGALGAVAVVCASIAAAALAGPCVGDRFEVPYPGATGVETRFADVPSPRFPGLWQEGRIEAYSYTIFANGDARLFDGIHPSNWLIVIDCDIANARCEETAQGTAPKRALQISEQMQLCFLSPESVTAPLPPSRPVGSSKLAEPIGSVATGSTDKVQVTEAMTLPTNGAAQTPPDTTILMEMGSSAHTEELSTPAPAPVPALPCGRAAVPADTPGFTLQRLIIAAGGDPGPLDGLPGRLTREALISVLGATAYDLDTETAIQVLDVFLCDASPS